MASYFVYMVHYKSRALYTDQGAISDTDIVFELLVEKGITTFRRVSLDGLLSVREKVPVDPDASLVQDLHNTVLGVVFKGAQFQQHAQCISHDNLFFVEPTQVKILSVLYTMLCKLFKNNCCRQQRVITPRNIAFVMGLVNSLFNHYSIHKMF